MNCPACGAKMDIINQTPRLQVNICTADGCPKYALPCVSDNEEYQAKVLPERVKLDL